MGNDVFGDKGGEGGVAPASLGGDAPKAPQQGGIAGKFLDVRGVP